MHQIILTTNPGKTQPYSIVTLRIDGEEVHSTGGYADPYSALLEMANWLVESWRHAEARIDGARFICEPPVDADGRPIQVFATSILEALNCPRGGDRR